MAYQYRQRPRRGIQHPEQVQDQARIRELERENARLRDYLAAYADIPTDDGLSSDARKRRHILDREARAFEKGRTAA